MKGLKILPVLVVAACAAGPARAQTLIGINDNQLFSINTATGAATVLGPTTYPGFASGMGFRAGKLYVYPEFSGTLYEINPTNGASIGAPIAIAGPKPNIEGDLAFRSDGVGFASGGGAGLWSFDLSAPVPTFTLINAATLGMDGLAFDAANNLYGIQSGATQLYKIDTVTGVATKVGAPTGIAPSGSPVGGLEFDAAGKLYGIVQGFPGAPQFFTVDTVTGVATIIGASPGSVRPRGIRFSSAGPPPPPPPPPAGTLLAVNTNQLIKIDIATGGVTVLGTMTIPGVPAGLDFRNGKLYTTPEGSNNLFEIDPTTGATITGPIPVAGSPPPLEGDIAFRPSDGVGFMTNDGNGVWRFDLSAPVPTFTQLTGAPPGGDGLAFDSAGTLWGLHQGGTQLYTIDQVTGVATNVGAPTGFNGGGISVGGLAIDSAGNFYGIYSTFPSVFALIKINPVTGIATLVTNVSSASGIRGIRFVPGGPPPPTPPPPGVPAVNGPEGTYGGSRGARGPEGCFGFGGGQNLRFRAAILLRPDASDRVFNVAFQNATHDESDASGSILLTAILLSGLAAFGILLYARRPA